MRHPPGDSPQASIQVGRIAPISGYPRRTRGRSLVAMPRTILIVDDEDKIRLVLRRRLEAAGFRVVEASDGDEAWDLFEREPPDAIVTDLNMPRCNGQELLRRIRTCSDAAVIMFSASALPEDGFNARDAGADLFISSQGLDIADMVRRIMAKVEDREASSVPGELEQRLVGNSSAIQHLRRRIASLAPLRGPVLISGPVGSGRDTVARALHAFGGLGDTPFVRVDVHAESTDELLRGAGAIYLDNVQLLDLALQRAWASWLDRARDCRYQDAPRLFASAPDPYFLGLAIPFDSKLKEHLWASRVEIAALDDRCEDIPAIATMLIRRLGTTLGRHVELSDVCMEKLSECGWPGNIAELERTLERAIGSTQGARLGWETVELALAEIRAAEGTQGIDQAREAKRARDKARLLKLLRETGGNVSEAAKRYPCARPHFYRLMKKHGLSRDGTLRAR
jgi:DNA-binding NtrC family response regulator